MTPRDQDDLRDVATEVVNELVVRHRQEADLLLTAIAEDFMWFTIGTFGDDKADDFIDAVVQTERLELSYRSVLRVVALARKHFTELAKLRHQYSCGFNEELIARQRFTRAGNDEFELRKVAKRAGVDVDRIRPEYL